MVSKQNPDAGLDVADVKIMVRELEASGKRLLELGDPRRAQSALRVAWLYVADADLPLNTNRRIRKLLDIAHAEIEAERGSPRRFKTTQRKNKLLK